MVAQDGLPAALTAAPLQGAWGVASGSDSDDAKWEGRPALNQLRRHMQGSRLKACALRAGLCNSKTVDISPAEGSAVTVTVSRPKNSNKPRSSKNSTTSKKRVQRQAPAVTKLVGSVRPDLQVGD